MIVFYFILFFLFYCSTFDFSSLSRKRGDWYIDMPGVSEEELVHYINSDHILLQSPVSFYNNSVPNYGQRHGHLTKHILFDGN